MTPGSVAANVHVPLAVVEATRALLWVRTAADARVATEKLVRQLGGVVVSADCRDTGALPTDISFGDGEPAVASAPPGTDARALLDAHLASFLLDARRALQLSARAERLDEDASTDRLTSLPNRRTLERALGRIMAHHTLVMVDLDHFKRVNDDFGHPTGDQVLIAFAGALRSVIRVGDFVGRFGGEEFVVILSGSVTAETFLERVRESWSAIRPLAVTFSAGIARFAGSSANTLGLADQALYQAKAAGRDRWVRARHEDAPNEPVENPPARLLDPYIDDAVNGERRSAIRTTLDLFNRGIPQDRVIVELLAAAQREVGERWQRNQLTVADEHVATGVSAAALDALVSEVVPPAGEGHTIVVCAEGDWHSLAAQMFGEALRGCGVNVTVLGASVPASYVAESLTRRQADCLAISCSLPIYFPGVVRLIDVAHLQGIPVIVGGRAFGIEGRHARRLGADAWAVTAGEAATILRQWRFQPPLVDPSPVPLDPLPMRLMERAAEITAATMSGLLDRLPGTADHGADEWASMGEDIMFNVQFLAASLLVDDDTIFADYVEWLQSLLANRRVAPTALPTGLDALRAGVCDEFPDAIRLLEVASRRLVDASVHATSGV